MAKLKIIILTLFYLAVSILSFSQTELLKNFLTVEVGLSHNEVTSIVQDNDGFIWIGTRGGLNRYDGYEFKIYNQVPGDSSSLVNPSVESLFVDSNGKIWIGTKSGGISKYDPISGIFKNIVSNYKHSSEILPGNRILCFHEDMQGRIWMGTWEDGLIVYDEKLNFSKIYLPGRMINVIVESDEGKIWIGESTGLYEYIESEDRLQRHNTGAIQKMAYDKKLNSLWLVHGGQGGFRKFDLRNHILTQYRIHSSIPELPDVNYPFESILIDSKDRIWIGSWGTGLFLFDKKSEEFQTYQIYPENGGTFNKDYDAILNIFEDADGNIWLGTNGGGICVLTHKLNFNSVGFNPEKFKGLENTRIMSVIEDRNNNLWLGTIGNGLVWSPDRENFYPVQYPDKIEPTGFFVIKNLFEDNDGNVWAGAGPGTYLVRFLNGKPKMIEAGREFNQENFLNQAVSFLDAYDMLWVGSLQSGLFLYDKKNNYRLVKQLQKSNSSSGDLQSDRISDLLQDSNGRIWLGTYNGLHVFSIKDTSACLAEQVLNIKGEFTGNIITSLEEDRKGNIWIGTPNGLNKMSIEDTVFNVTYYTEKDGLASNFIKGISHDSNGNIWVSTSTSISMFDIQSGTFINFNEMDGIRGKNFTEASVFRNNRGELFFGGDFGLTYFQPEEIKPLKKVNKPVFTDLKIFNQHVEINEKYGKSVVLNQSISAAPEIKIPYRFNNLEIQFSALDYKSMGGNSYKYMLENLDKEWQNLGKRRFINFINLMPGEYVLKVKCSNSHSVWNDEATAIKIHILPPFWQTWYALLIYIILVISIVTIIRWNAVKQVRLANSLEIEKLQHEQDQKMNELKLRFFTNISHEFRTPLTLILAPLKELIRKQENYNLSEEVSSKIIIIQNNAQRLMKLVNQLLDFRKTESGTMKLSASLTNLEDFTSEVCYSFEELAKINNIEFRFHSSLKTKQIWFDRDKLEVILNNLISNAFKYVQGMGKIEVALYEEEDEVLIAISDNGPGISPTEIKHIFDRFYRVNSKENYGSTGIGLDLAKRYTEMHKGTISVTSEPNVSTEFVVSLPKGNKHLSHADMVELEDSPGKNLRKESLLNTVLPSRPKPAIKSAECVLIVEDEPDMNSYLVNLLEPFYHVEKALNGTEGFEKASEIIPDLIISDVVMPGLDGFEFCKQVRSNEKTATVPFIFLTAKNDEQFRLLAVQSGADDLISKPFDPGLLLEKVKNILANRKKLQKQYSKSIRLEPLDIEITSSDEIFIEKAIFIIEKNLQNHKFSSEYLASELNLSNSSLYRKLKGLTNSSTAEFIRSIRIKRAAQLLADREKTITEIAYEVGFNDVKHFRTVFQKQFGCSPSEYREKL